MFIKDFSSNAKFKLAGVFLSVFLCGLSLAIIPSERLKSFYYVSGFYFIFATFLFWVFMLLPRQTSKDEVKAFLVKHGAVALLIPLLIGAMFLASPMAFRILADETNLLGIAASMYDEHSFNNMTSGLYYFDNYHKVHQVWGIRPIFFPFLIYLVHTLTGYSAYNGFIVNAIAGAATLWCFYWLLSRWFVRSVAVSGMLVMAAFPVFVLWVTSTGFEIVNVALAVMAFIWFYRFLEERDNHNLERLLLTLALLAQTRYESAVFAVGILTVVAITFRRKEYENLTLRVLIIPWLFLPVLWQRLLKTSASDYQVYNGQQVFSLENFLKHARFAFDYFIGSEPRYGTIPVVSYLAVAGLAVGLFLLWRNRRSLPTTLWGMAVAATVSYVLLCVAVFSYFWGNLTSPFTIRLGIVFIPLLVLLFIIPLNLLVRRSQSAQKMLLLSAIAIIFFHWPAAGKNESVTQLTLYRQYRTTVSFLEQNYPDPNIVIIADRPGLYSAHRWGAVKFNYANQHHQRMKRELKRRLYQDILVIQLIQDKDGKPLKEQTLDPAFRLKTIFESQHSATKITRISKVIL
mgnify:CR=1 FL=1